MSNIHFRMIDVGAKKTTHRLAIARGQILIGQEAFTHVKARTLPKGDVLLLAEIAGIQGAKMASQLIPLCHPMGLDHVEIRTELLEDKWGVTVYCCASTLAKTGVEMEALSGVNAALLTIWDLCKMIQPCLAIEGVELLAKAGGKGGVWINPHGIPEWVSEMVCPAQSRILQNIGFALITLSDRASLGVYSDESTPVAKTYLENLGAHLTEQHLIPDESELLISTLHSIIAQGKTQLIITTGGTGIGPRDCTPDAIAKIADKIIPGIGEQLRIYGSQFTRHSWSSRSIGAAIGTTLLITLPGSPKAVKEGLECLHLQIPHLIQTLGHQLHE